MATDESTMLNAEIEREENTGLRARVFRFALACLGGLIPGGGLLTAAVGAWSDADTARFKEAVGAWLDLQESERREAEQILLGFLRRLEAGFPSFTEPNPAETRPAGYNDFFWDNLQDHPKTKGLFERSGCNWKALPSPHKELCIWYHNEAFRVLGANT